MTMAQLQQKEEKGSSLKVFQVTSGDYYVESSEGKVCYRVSLDTRTCTCGDYAGNVANDKDFVCKHMLAAMRFSETDPKPKLDDRFIVAIKGTDFVKYAGVLDLAHQKGIRKLFVDTVQYPAKENADVAICKATLISNDGGEYTDYGDANPSNVSAMVVRHILRVASTRAKARVLRDFTNIGMTCLEELSDLDEAEPQKTPEKSNIRTLRKPREEKDAPVKQADIASAPHQKDHEKEKEAPEQSPAHQEPQNKPQGQTDPAMKIATAQMQAIINLAKRRGLTEDEIRQRIEEKYHIRFEEMDTADARGLIRSLQQSA